MPPHVGNHLPHNTVPYFYIPPTSRYIRYNKQEYIRFGGQQLKTKLDNPDIVDRLLKHNGPSCMGPPKIKMCGKNPGSVVVKNY